MDILTFLDFDKNCFTYFNQINLHKNRFEILDRPTLTIETLLFEKDSF